MAREDVCVCATNTHGSDAHQNIVRRNLRPRHITHFEPADVHQHQRLHRRAHSGGHRTYRTYCTYIFTNLHYNPWSSSSMSLVSRRPSSRNTANCFIVSLIPTSNGVDGRSPT